ncbi:MAG TPA: efflux RND transporter permease subunit [Bacteroidales bacterium]|nr:efflux RND transporter permease subunit [Bacteroidales bacterium]HPC14461.1 efflux RND transporter permease subunit [Bacteroidales bacterium]HPY09941.1 efflux RND transporter permease subunit [Bacteroidales bacterium]HQB25229.1 efflux RND transporter permease subunit [Bacteroidales bacterium]HQF19348.1 efflux RND transporter permease subunit [Bacteroidales bacterium]
MSLYSESVRKPITTIMIFVAVIVLGIFSLINLPIDLMPDMDIPAMSVITYYPGASAEDIEVNVTKPLENQLNSLQNLKKVISTSKDNISFILIQFEYGTNMDQASNDVRDLLSLIEKTLPDQAEKPTLFKFNSSMMPVVIYGVTAQESYPALEKLIDERITERLSRIDGVGAVTVMGKPERIIDVRIDPRKLDSYGLTLEQIGNVIGAENLALPAGRMEVGQMEFPVRTNGEFKSSDVVKDIVVFRSNAGLVYLKDIAQVKDTLKYIYVDERIDGEVGVRLMVQKQSGANTVQIAKLVRERMDELSKELPKDVKIVKIVDTSEFIQNSINNLSETLLYAFIFVTLVVFIFLGRWRSTFIILLTIPVSLIAAFIFLYAIGGTLNIISLSALAIAIGMVVDDAIVVLENITKHLERGSNPMEAAVFATREVGLAVVASTLVIVAVFFPLTLMTGLTGVVFRQLGWIVSITITISVLAALSLTPMLSSRILKSNFYYNYHPNKSLAGVSRFWGYFDEWYAKILSYALRHKKLILSLAFVIFIGSLFLFKFIGTEFIPEQDNGRIGINIEIPQGVRIDESKKLARDFEEVMKQKYPEIELVSTSIGIDEEGSLASAVQRAGSYIINITLRLSSAEERSRSIYDIADSLRNDLTKYPIIASSYVSVGGSRSQMGISMVGGGGNNVVVNIFGYDINKTNYIADQLSSFMKTQPGFRDVTISRDKDRLELQVIPDRTKLAQLGMNTAMLSSAIRNRVLGFKATKYREEGNEYDVIVKYNDENLVSVDDIRNITFRGPQGNLIRVNDVAEVKEVYTTPNIEHENKIRVVRVEASLKGTDLGKATAQINSKLKTLDVPPQIFVEISGAAKDMADTFRDLGLLSILILLLTYIVMASQFESLREPFIIMFSVPFAITGVLISLFITHTSINIISGIGIVMLIGIAVKNSIVLVDFINLLVGRGYSIRDAIIAGGKSRLRPILMTSFTTLLGMLPLAISHGEGSEIWRPLGISIIGGLFFSMLISLIIVPVIYSLFAHAKKRREENNKIPQELHLPSE